MFLAYQYVVLKYGMGGAKDLKRSTSMSHFQNHYKLTVFTQYKEVQLWSAVSDNNILKCFTTQDIMEHGTTKCICSLCITMYYVLCLLCVKYCIFMI